MNWDLFKDSICYSCLADAKVTSWSLTQEVSGLKESLLLSISFITEFSEYIHSGKTQL